MYRFALALVLSTSSMFAAADCSVTGRAYDNSGRPLRAAVVRLVDLQTRQASFGATNTDAAFQFSGQGGHSYRLDLVSPPTVVTGSHIPTRSVLGTTTEFGCVSGTSQDVHALVN